MKKIIVVGSVVLPLLASANTSPSLENLEGLSQQYSRECFRLADLPNKTLTQLDKAIEVCELAQVYHSADYAKKGRGTAFNDLTWFCKGVELRGLDRRILACDLAIELVKYYQK